MDVGGGSTEFIQGVGSPSEKIERHRSLQLGAVRMTEQFGEARFTELCAFLRDTLRRELADYSLSDRRLIGTGGTILTLAAVGRHLRVGACEPVSGETPTHRVGLQQIIDHATLTCDEARSLVERLRAMSLSERRNVPGLPSERADIIVAGGAVVVAAMEVLDATGLTPPQAGLTVSVRSLRFGALAPNGRPEGFRGKFGAGRGILGSRKRR